MSGTAYSSSMNCTSVSIDALAVAMACVSCCCAALPLLPLTRYTANFSSLSLPFLDEEEEDEEEAALAVSTSSAALDAPYVWPLP